MPACRVDSSWQQLVAYSLGNAQNSTVEVLSVLSVKRY